MGELAAEKHVQYILSVEKVASYIHSFLLLSYSNPSWAANMTLLSFLWNIPVWSPSQRKDDFVSVVMEHLRMNGAYWGLTTLDLLGKLYTVDVDEVVSWVMECQHESGLYGYLVFSNQTHHQYAFWCIYYEWAFVVLWFRIRLLFFPYNISKIYNQISQTN